MLFGLWFGMIHTLGSFVGAILGTLIAGYLHGFIGDWLIPIFGSQSLSRSIVFIFILILVSRLAGFGFFVIEKTLMILTRLPFLKQADRLIGMVLGFFEGLLVLGSILFTISRYPLQPWLADQLSVSVVAAWLVNSAAFIYFLLPKNLKELQSIIKTYGRY